MTACTRCGFETRPCNAWRHERAHAVAETYEISASGCWLWTGKIDGKGYGRLTIAGRDWMAHRYVFEVLHARPVPAGHELDHLCRVTRCVNPDHMEPVSHAVNVWRGIGPTALNARKTHCPRGHEYDYRWERGDRRQRSCRACNLAAVRRYKLRRRDRAAAAA